VIARDKRRGPWRRGPFTVTNEAKLIAFIRQCIGDWRSVSPTLKHGLAGDFHQNFR
jgi:hypothetical protein